MHADHRLGTVLRDQIERVLGDQFGVGTGISKNKLDLTAENAARSVYFLRR